MEIEYKKYFGCNIHKYLDILLEAVSNRLESIEKDNDIYGNNASKTVVRKYIHLLDTFQIGKCIMGKELSDYLAGALLLHDIGKFISDDSENHPLLGYDFLKGKGVLAPQLLLPIKYHENDTTWKTLIKMDEEYLSESESAKKEIIVGCVCVRDADIISNLISIANEPITYSNYNKDLMELLLCNRLGNIRLVKSFSDKILYILCGLSLLELPQSIQFVRRIGVVNWLYNQFCRAVYYLGADDNLNLLKSKLRPFFNDNTDISDYYGKINISDDMLWIIREKFFYISDIINELKSLEKNQNLQLIIKGSWAWMIFWRDFYRVPGDFDLSVRVNGVNGFINICSLLQKTSKFSEIHTSVEGNEKIITAVYKYRSLLGDNTSIEIEISPIPTTVTEQRVSIPLTLLPDGMTISMPDIYWMLKDKEMSLQEAIEKKDNIKISKCNKDIQRMRAMIDKNK